MQKFYHYFWSGTLVWVEIPTIGKQQFSALAGWWTQKLLHHHFISIYKDIFNPYI